jgi:V/A-type H+-transporting ATPase subunit I
MLFPERMLHTEITLKERNLYSGLEAIGKTGMLHIEPNTGQRLFYRQYERAEKLLTTVEEYIHFLKIYPSETKSGIKSGGEDPGEILSEIESDISSAAPEINHLANAFKRLEQKENLLKQAEEFSEALKEEVDIDILAERLEYVGIKTAIIPSERIETFTIALKRYNPMILYAGISEGSTAAAILYDPDTESHISTAIAKIEGRELSISLFRQGTREETEAERSRLEKEFAISVRRYGKRLGEHYARLKYLVKIFSVRNALEKCETGYRLSGWIPRRKSGKFRNALPYASINFFVAGDDAPVLLHTPAFLKSFESMIRGFSYPSYNEINPTVPFAVAFIVMFGAMFGDIGHGLILMMAGSMVRHRWKSYKNLGDIYILAGTGSMLFGFFYGSLFGIHDLIPHLFFSPVERVDLSIYTGICIGIFFISLSFFLNIFSMLRRKAFSSLVFGEGGILWMLIYWLAIGISIKAMVFRLPVSSELLLLGGLVLVVATMLVIRKGNPFQNLFATMIRLFEHAVNTISFARLGAFALAHGALFLALFSLADIVSDPQIHGPGYWFIILLGNLFIIGLEGVVVTIQTLRLEYYEFFKRFFRGGGHPYTPYRLESE